MSLVSKRVIPYTTASLSKRGPPFQACAGRFRNQRFAHNEPAASEQPTTAAEPQNKPTAGGPPQTISWVPFVAIFIGGTGAFAYLVKKREKEGQHRRKQNLQKGQLPFTRDTTKKTSGPHEQ